jgi:hypothetical protein
MHVTVMTMTSARVPVGEGKTRRTLMAPDEVLAELQAWRAAQRPIPTESQAIVELLTQALLRWREENKAER